MGNPVVHFEIGGKDVEKLIDFYGSVFEWDITPLADQLYIVDPGSDKGIQGHLFQATEETDSANNVIIYVEVDDIHASSMRKWKVLAVRSSYHRKKFRGMQATLRCSAIRMVTRSVCCNQECKLYH